jgi:hypothetical protein
MTDITNGQDTINEQTGGELLNAEISDDALEAAACVARLGAYTEFAWCTQAACPG